MAGYTRTGKRKKPGYVAPVIKRPGATTTRLKRTGRSLSEDLASAKRSGNTRQIRQDVFAMNVRKGKFGGRKRSHRGRR